MTRTTLDAAAATWEAIDSLSPWAQNPRNNDDAVEQVAESIRRFGFASPIIARAADRSVIAGHTRLKAAQQLGLDLVPVRFVDLDEDEARALALADNKLNEIATWDEAGLAEVMRELEQTGLDLAGLGWQSDELDALLSEIDPEPAAPEPAELDDADSEPGAWYQLGPHRLYCGSCTDVDWGSPGCLVYDPPWDAPIVTNWTPPSAPSVLAFTDGARLSDVVSKFGAQMTWLFAWDCVSSWWTPNRPLRRMKLCAWYGSLDSYDQEGAFYTPRGGAADEGPRIVSNTRGSYEYTPHPEGRRLSDLYQHPITALHSDGEHPHEKPLDWMRCLIGNTSAGLVADPFAGSGASLIAADELGREWCGSEIDPAACDRIRARYRAHRGES